MNVAVSFPGGVAVEADVKGHRVRTDQSRPYGDDSAAAPFDLFIASIATCMGFYALRFCQERGIATEGLGLSVETVRD
ncbi:MAG TPA: osmotically inducible protein OsmC, partial [Thermoanaerobaculia bacterium]|nr:osmotically inducible protein OsmC [Thermoanaerobaculia bacterium]